MIDSVNSATAGSAGSGSRQGASALASDFETFLLMLTTQAKNQDPLEPLDSSEYASQLAQFSMVEQQVQTNSLLAELTNTIGLNQLSSWIGTEVRAAADFRYDGEPVDIETLVAATADRATLVIRDANEAEVARIPIPIDQTEFEWDGVGNTGELLPHGTYSATVESHNGRQLLASIPAAAFSRVVEAQIRDDLVTLTLDSGAIVSADSVRQVRKGA
ncbi:flagellar basal body rod modification protein FlgD [Ruegeria sp. ANG-S4]|uniref:flagellar hook capping FlgD N-terminal domain-containing protein n=1 Tax=Ruegeria sp. ANG-S4 TaxID=1577904 RepID=UPI0005808D3D|nr:flagellar hook capping FlgD N-terminal domain-containing protein [Ruegeria sp. ANG-S4]KIC45222.1 flagellar basal body rod modification protein FlgD [Ruegeria sp. ANG-S4]